MTSIAKKVNWKKAKWKARGKLVESSEVCVKNTKRWGESWMSAVQTWWCFQVGPQWSRCSAGCVRMGLDNQEIGFDQMAHSWGFPRTRLKRVGKTSQTYENQNQWGQSAPFGNFAFCKLYPLKFLPLSFVIDTAQICCTSSSGFQVGQLKIDRPTSYTRATNDLILWDLCTNVFTSLV